MKQLKKTTLYLLLLVILLPLLSIRPLFKKAQPFSLKTISVELPFHPEWEGRTLSEEENLEVSNALSKSYHYLGSGGQNFVFISDDGKYVIKFFKQNKFDIPLWIKHFPLPFLVHSLHEKKTMKMQAKRNAVFSAFKLSFDHLSKETGLLYVHLNTTDHLKKTLTLSCPQGNLHQLSLDTLPFVLQKKADLAINTIDSFMENNDIARAKHAIDQLLELPVVLAKKGFRNRDPNFRSNCGFINSQAVIFDVGRIVYSKEIQKPENFKKAFLKTAFRFRRYLSDRHPELLPYFDQCIAMKTGKNAMTDVSLSLSSQ